MAYSDNFPATRPVFQADFANGGRIDPRATFSRSDTPPTYAAPSAVHYWSNEKHLSSDNLLTYSNPNNAVWNESNGASVTTNAAAAPDGTTTASSIVEDSANSQHRTFASINATSGQVYTLVAYLKANGRTIAQVATSGAVSSNVEFDLSSSGTATTRSGSPANSSISQIGSSGWYKCSFQVTAGSTATLYLNVYLCDSANSNSYTGDGSSGVYAYGFNLSTTGQLVHEDTSGQIHREYAPTLKSVATAGQPRFEYDPASDGQSMGILIEGQSQNLIARSDSIDNAYWTKSNCTVSASAAVGVTGALNACLITESAEVSPATAAHEFYSSIFGLSSATGCTVSLYCKSAGVPRLRLLSTIGGSTRNVIFDIANGTVVSEASATGAVESVGNGFYRISMTYTPTATTNGRLYLTFLDASSNVFYTGNGYNSLITSGFQFEQNSFASSFISSDSGSQTTRAAESLSVATADITGFSEGVGTVVYETGGVASSTATNQLAFGLRADSANFFTAGVNNGGVSDASVRVYSKTSDGDQAFLNPGTATVGTGYKLACRFELDNIAASMNGGAVVSDTSGKVPVGVNTLWVGQLAGNFYLNSNIKRIALYNEALSDTNLQALTS